MKQDDFKNRYLIKLASSVVIAGLNMLIQLILPRALSVADFGYYNYNLNVFTSIVVMANLSASNALVAKYSKRNEEIGLVYFYLKFYAVVALILNTAVLCLYSTSFMRSTFAGQSVYIVLLGLEVAIINKLQTDIISVYDASAVSRFPALMQIVLKVLVSTAVLMSFLFGRLELVWFYTIQICITVSIVSVLIVAILKSQKKRYPQSVDLGYRVYFKEYYIYCRPLVLATIASQAVIIVMNWALMKWSGATQQAMFGAAWQINTLLGYVFSPYAELSKREFAVLQHETQALKERFYQALKLMMWVTSYFAIFIAVMVDWLLPILYGERYSGAAIVTVLMMFYTIYQAWGQVSGAYLLALEKTSVSAKISILGQGLTLLFVFLFQIPNFIWPNSLGSTGIALTYLLANVISTTVSVSFISGELGLPVLRTNAIQFAPILLCGILAVGMKFLIGHIVAGTAILYCVIKVFFSGLLYTAAIVAVLYLKPDLMGVSRESINGMIKKRR